MQATRATLTAAPGSGRRPVHGLNSRVVRPVCEDVGAEVRVRRLMKDITYLPRPA